ncbi:MAG: SRPBCC domain-containing protein [Rhizobiaceae bacterium]
MDATTKHDPARTIEVSRLINAPRDLVFKMFTEAKHIDAWWGPNGFRNETHEMNFFVGGIWRYTMHGPDGKDWPNWIKYKVIKPPELMVYDHGEEIGGPAHFEGNITFEVQGEMTFVTLRLLFPSAEIRDATIKFGAVEGGEQTLARLENHVAAQEQAPIILEDRPFVISRTFDAPRQLVFDCFTKPEHMQKWWGPKGVKIVKSSMDLRPGGMYHYGMQAGDAPIMWGRQVYREITPPSHIVLINSFSDENGGLTRHPGAPSWPIELYSTFTFEELEKKKTKLTIRWELMENATSEERETFLSGFDSMNMGWGGTLDQLGDYLKKA